MVQKLIKSNTKILLLISVICYSCIPLRRLEYVQSKTDDNLEFAGATKQVQRIRAGDELYIRVSSFDEVSFNFFSSHNENRQMNYGNEISLSLISYSVDDSGYIYFPILDKIYLMDLSIEEATYKMKTMLSEYFNQPTVLLKYVNKKISILGEVRNPGHYTYSKDRISVLEAISMAGDISITGNRKMVVLIREENNMIVKKSLNLTRVNLLNSNDYYLKSNDILYIKPIRASTWRTISVPISLTFSTITTILLVFNTFR